MPGEFFPEDAGGRDKVGRAHFKHGWMRRSSNSSPAQPAALGITLSSLNRRTAPSGWYSKNEHETPRPMVDARVTADAVLGSLRSAGRALAVSSALALLLVRHDLGKPPVGATRCGGRIATTTW